MDRFAVTSSGANSEELAQSTTKAEIRQRKVMLLIWCDWKGIVFFGLLPRNETISSSVYCRQLESNNVIHKKRSELTPDSIHYIRDSLKIVVKMECVIKLSLFTSL